MTNNQKDYRKAFKKVFREINSQETKSGESTKRDSLKLTDLSPDIKQFHEITINLNQNEIKDLLKYIDYAKQEAKKDFADKIKEEICECRNNEYEQEECIFCIKIGELIMKGEKENNENTIWCNEFKI